MLRAAVAISEGVNSLYNLLAQSVFGGLFASSHDPEEAPRIPGLSRETVPDEVQVQLKEATFQGTAFGKLIRWLAGIGAVALFVWGIIKGVMEVTKGRGGGITGILRQIMPMFIFAALLTMLTTLPGLVIGIIVAPITWLFDLINSAIQNSQTEP